MHVVFRAILARRVHILFEMIKLRFKNLLPTYTHTATFHLDSNVVIHTITAVCCEVWEVCGVFLSLALWPILFSCE